MGTDSLRFAAIRHRSLAAAGLGSTGVDVSLVGDTLTLSGAGGEQLIVPLASITRLRAGYEENKYTADLYRMKLWTSAAPRPLTLATIHSTEAGYATIARAIAATVERTHGPGAVEGGLGWGTALLFPMWLVVGFTVAVFAVYVDPEHRNHDSFLTIALMEAAIGLPIILLVMLLFFRPYRPRRLKDLAALGRFLPGRSKFRLWRKRSPES